MSTMASQITGASIVCSAFCSGADQRKHQSSTSLAFVRENSPVTGEFPAHKGQVTRKMFPFDDVIVYSATRWVQGQSSVSIGPRSLPFTQRYSDLLVI